MTFGDVREEGAFRQLREFAEREGDLSAPARVVGDPDDQPSVLAVLHAGDHDPVIAAVETEEGARERQLSSLVLHARVEGDGVHVFDSELLLFAGRADPDADVDVVRAALRPRIGIDGSADERDRARAVVSAESVLGIGDEEYVYQRSGLSGLRPV